MRGDRLHIDVPYKNGRMPPCWVWSVSMGMCECRGVALTRKRALRKANRVVEERVRNDARYEREVERRRLLDQAWRELAP